MTIYHINLPLKEVCSRFEEEAGMRVAVKEGAGRKMKADCKPEPLRNLDCERENCMSCRSGNPGKCERNSAGYRISVMRGSWLEARPCMRERQAEMLMPDIRDPPSPPVPAKPNMLYSRGSFVDIVCWTVG